MTLILAVDGAAPLWPWLSVLVQLLAALAPVATAAAVWVAYGALKQRGKSDDRAAWWERASTSMELMTARDTARMNAGMVMADHLTDSPLATAEDRRMFLDVVDSLISAMIETAESDDPAESNTASQDVRSRGFWRLRWRRRQ